MPQVNVNTSVNNSETQSVNTSVNNSETQSEVVISPAILSQSLSRILINSSTICFQEITKVHIPGPVELIELDVSGEQEDSGSQTLEAIVKRSVCSVVTQAFFP